MKILSGRVALRLVGPLLFVGTWELLSRLGWVRADFIPAPHAVAVAGLELARSGELAGHIRASAFRAAIGFVTGSVIGIATGIATARLKVFQGLTDPLLQMFRAIPSLAFVPLAVFWFGIGETAKLFLIGWGVFFPVWVATFLGIRDTSPLIQRAGAALGARGWRMLWFVVIPAALPMILAGLRVSLATAFVVLVAAELAGALAGVGYMIQVAQLSFRVDQMFVGLITLGAMGLGADLLFRLVTRRLFPWYGAERINDERLR